MTYIVIIKILGSFTPILRKPKLGSWLFPVGFRYQSFFFFFISFFLFPNSKNVALIIVDPRVSERGPDKGANGKGDRRNYGTQQIQMSSMCGPPVLLLLLSFPLLFFFFFFFWGFCLYRRSKFNTTDEISIKKSQNTFFFILLPLNCQVFNI